MKNSLIIMIAFFCVLAFGCKKSDQDLTQELLVGKWKIDRIEYIHEDRNESGLFTFIKEGTMTFSADLSFTLDAVLDVEPNTVPPKLVSDRSYRLLENRRILMEGNAYDPAFEYEIVKIDRLKLILQSLPTDDPKADWIDQSIQYKYHLTRIL